MYHSVFPTVTDVLNTGEKVQVREVGPGDAALLRAGFADLSDQSRYFRFLSQRPEPIEDILHRVTAPNTAVDFSIGALTCCTGAPKPLGLARYIRAHPTDFTAEITLTVIDTHQQRGLGRLLLTHIAGHAHRNDVDTFYALVHPRNRGMLSLLSAFGSKRSGSIGEEAEIMLPLDRVVAPVAAP